MKDFKKEFAISGNRKAVLSNSRSDPSMWILDIYKKILFFNKKTGSYWFYDKQEAEKYALAL
ncbi:MAG TPA: hypothetical protein PKA90_12835 [Ignavibacteria bacterium]|nr:hypothetical protein [Ignavibacteria bacterium]HMR41305.1 hypothetical protein [Ignavibacteria bacterium]